MIYMSIILGGVLVGFLSGFLAGLVGIGGGFIFVPLIMSVYSEVSIHKAIATSSGFTIAAGLSSFISHYKRAKPYWDIAAGFLSGSFAGAIAGPFIALRIPDGVLIKLFALVVILPSALRLLKFSFSPKLKYIFLSGLLVGCFSSIFGIGGGILLMPILVQAFNMDLRRSVTTSAIFITINSTVATAVYTFKGVVQWDILAVAAPAGVAGAILGSRISQKLKPVYIKTILVILTFLVIARMLMV
jgi:hypothetical protein